MVSLKIVCKKEETRSKIYAETKRILSIFEDEVIAATKRGNYHVSIPIRLLLNRHVRPKLANNVQAGLNTRYGSLAFRVSLTDSGDILRIDYL